MNKNKIFFEYLKTFFLTILVAFIVVIIFLAIIQHQVFKEESSKTIKEDTIDYYMIGVLIEKNKYLEQQYPKDYKFNIRLGVLYEVQKKLKEAEAEYKMAELKAPFGEFKPQYKLALLYLRMNRLDEAQAMMDNIAERPDKRLIRYKADIYNRLGDKYYNMADYEDAVDKYEKALFYYKIIKSDQIKTVNNSLASSFVYLADEKVKNLQIDDAIDSLEDAYKIVDAPILRYKLAILYTATNPDLAYDYFEDVFKREPSLINYDEYYKFLSDMAIVADSEGDTAKAELYRFKIKQLQEYYKSNILSIEDLRVESAEGTIKLNRWSRKYNINLKLSLKNVSNYNMNSLFLQTVFTDGNEVINDYTQQIVDSQSILKAGQVGPIINVRTFKKETGDDKSPKEIIVDIYASKSQTSYKILLKTITIKEKVKKRRGENWFSRLFHL